MDVHGLRPRAGEGRGFMQMKLALGTVRQAHAGFNAQRINLR